ncbi:MAG: hypothetical protein ACT4ON_10805 [Bacteroidota bacterium]
MKTKFYSKVAFLSILFITGAIIYSSCNKEELSQLPVDKSEQIDTENLQRTKEGCLQIIKNRSDYFLANYKFGNIHFSYEAKAINNFIIMSSFEVNGMGKTGKFKTKYTLNTKKISYKLLVHKDIISEAAKKIHTIKQLEADEIVKLYEIFAKLILEDPAVDYKSELVQSLFFHNGVLNTMRRSLKENVDCGCTPHPGYFVNKTPFWCQEDFFINPQSFIDKINTSNYTLKDEEMKAYEYLQRNFSQPLISVDKLFNILEPKDDYLERIENVYDLSTGKNNPSAKKRGCKKGSDLGCCGNYAGCCWYESLACLWHDIICISCDKWHCGPGCET